LLYRQERYAAVSYESLEVSLSFERCVEEGEVPADAEVVGHTWRFTREDGRPDRRYAPNPRLPEVVYGLLRLAGPSGLDVRLQVSDRAAAARFARVFGAEVKAEEKAREGARSERPRGESPRSEEQEKARRFVGETEAVTAARETLGVAIGASNGEISAAYRNLARMYHPDKVANLSPEVREFADQKMKEINAAYARLKGRGK
jgi:hypothetical protein